MLTKNNEHLSSIKDFDDDDLWKNMEDLMIIHEN